MPMPETCLLIENLFNADLLLKSRQWTPLQPGVNLSLIYQQTDDGARAGLLHYLPGARVPDHKHLGIEHILILHGSQIDGQKIYTAGTLVIHSAHSNHQIHSIEGCIALGIWQRPVQFTD